MKYIKEIFVGVAILIAVAWLTAVFFTDKPNVVYSISDAIPTSLINSDSSEIIQQLYIKNIGQLPAENIIIKITKPILHFDIRKSSDFDSVKTSVSKIYTQINYQRLPPQSSFTILIKLFEEPLLKESIEIKHDKGIATEAFAKESNTSFIQKLLIGLYALLTIFQIRRIILYDYETDAEYYNPEKILKKTKPFLMGLSRWKGLREKAIQNFFKLEIIYLETLKQWRSYHLLYYDKPLFLSDTEWKKLLYMAELNFKKNIESELNQKSHITLKDDIFNLQKPNNINENAWDDIIKILNNYYVFIAIKDKYITWQSKIEEELEYNKPMIITDETFNQVKKIRLSFYYAIVLKDMRWRSREEVEKRFKLEYLDETLKESINIIFENKDKEKSIQIEKDKNFALRLKLFQTSYGRLTEDGKELIDQKDWEELKKINSEIKEILEDRKKAVEDKIKFENLKEKVEAQLDIIDKLLNDPSFIDKIEDYNNCFAKGNFDNIKKVAAILDQRLPINNKNQL